MNRPSHLVDAAPHEARFTVEQFIAIAESGALDRYSKAELIDGRIVVVNAQTVWHMRARLAVVRALQIAIGDSDPALEVGSEGSVILDGGAMPEPDVFVWKPSGGERWVPGSALLLVVEIASSTEQYDLGDKRRLYAGAGVPEYWVVIERTGRIERFADPLDGDYRRHDGFTFAEGCASLTLPGVDVPAGLLRA